MKNTAATIEEYIDQLPEERKEVVQKLQEVIKASLPTGFVEEMNYGMIGYVVPHITYPAGYHCNPKLPLPFINIGNQKNFISIYHMGMYSEGTLHNWFVAEWSKHSSRKLDMGKCCIRFKKLDEIPYKLIGELVAKITTQQWIETYEKTIKKG